MIGPSNDLSSKLALDTNALGGLKQSAKAGSPEALKTASTQFEAMFINMMMKSMRDATPQGEGMLDSQQTKTFTTMLDQQMSQNLAKRGVGLADVLIRQLSSQATNAQALAINGDPSAQPAQPIAIAGDQPARRIALPPGRDAGDMIKTPGALVTPATATVPGVSASGRPQSPHVREFQEKLGAHADEASRATGIPAKFMLGQAALESGWGKREIRNADGSASHNLFGIKAGPGWTGKVATAVTTEYVNGKPQTKVEKFRAYDSYADSFKDYAKLITDNPRYEKVLAHAQDAAGFAHGLQKAGYATDPLYAAKLTKIIQRNLA
ncbi:flagellar assembly peptidoglycan hydrolase FlgJ [Massilia antarctica]|uniref:flagellar assembly peptidoglycan hydrolase FlgJ n=1 Tax=Massilia antarctica TaxID=2765360 RepID=UPI0006BB56C1|nr:flagellar assembly peptidoglycan hydrolase FlgJ [Massilia sp. H27-R4]MCY0911378.1 flagellar assembly peptidoglycan hydrolase FlgJ [Massilia sp. H27-R4]CUI05018.1 Flagellar protein FlgJ [peptidoglycan hydrolase] [Janthinobacterium sp. CG23_2]CUU28804.1 Flagellar protein FlgJ [peptidoglycan hydrolase] [Janthinobacterium sp. CG23_2]